MKLSRYIDLTGIAAKDFAAMVEVTPAAICNYAQGIRKPRPEIALRIVKATKGKVSWADLYAGERVEA